MPERRTIATLDLGSNSFHMLIARVDGEHITTLDSLREPVRLRLGLSEDGTLSAEAQKRALQCLKRFAQRLRGLEPDNVRVVGTNTLRRARNAREFLEKVEEILPVPVDVIGGSEEARLIYLGVATHLPRTNERNFVIDIGGGSTELIIGRDLEPLLRESRPMGCVAFSMRFFPGNLITRKRWQTALMEVRQELEGYQHTFSPEQWDRVYGASGTIKAVGAIHQALWPHATGLTREGMEGILNRLVWGKPVAELSLPNLREDRLPVFLGGFAILYGIFNLFAIKHMDISPHSLREGVLYDLLGREQNRDKRQSSVARLMDFFSVDRRQAERVRRLALALFEQIADEVFHHRAMAKLILGWAADLHEVGLAIAHTGYHKHGAYILMNGDMDGFSQVEQGLLGFLVINHRKRLKTEPLPYETQLEWPLVFALRVAYTLHRDRTDIDMPAMAVRWRKKRIFLDVDGAWLERHPLTHYDLQIEQTHWKRIGYKLYLNGETPR